MSKTKLLKIHHCLEILEMCEATSFLSTDGYRYVSQDQIQSIKSKLIAYQHAINEYIELLEKRSKELLS